MFYTYKIYNQKTGQIFKYGKGSGDRLQESVNEVARRFEDTNYEDQIDDLRGIILETDLTEDQAFESERQLKETAGGTIANGGTLLFE